ncbi:hypothetical protein BCR32DRAFT_293481 [Anaeromyces robustus]|uniref:UBR-type domain-containing protein n=1 Tax=Anaeromyces robustus TaxID=1754192 RepID=A0A1Y1X5D5_9FUNG|nr:hypothetical protein BCR32DRAFT_293481 [Anaeromyces robustus]|eukprot:ORX81030.1 hypothetical protein BCR32DRAFT_293481 [Anaeromyces robustus]
MEKEILSKKNDNDENKENYITAVDYLIKQEELEQEAKEVYSKKFDKCTYDLGYIKQQVYVCMTCTNGNAGFCYSCSIACHSQHDVRELFSKRNFRCDCGNSKFQEKCCLKDKSGTLNENNKYNHNFSGRFCWCNKIYDPDEDELMFQCNICEEWYHASCITKDKEKLSESFDDYICRDCVDKYNFIKKYKFMKKICFIPYKNINKNDNLNNVNNENSLNNNTVNDKRKFDEMNMNTNNIIADTNSSVKKIKIESDINTNTKQKINNNEITPENQNLNEKTDKNLSNDTDIKNNEKKSVEKLIDIEKLEEDDDDDDCLLSLSSINEEEQNQRYDVFCDNKFNTIFCKCNRCKEMYKKRNISFLIEDDLTYEPEEDDDLDGTLFERGVKVLNHASRVPLIECISGYNKLKDKLTDYFKQFAEQKKVVTDEDIKYFFDNLHYSKKKNIY